MFNSKTFFLPVYKFWLTVNQPNDKTIRVQYIFNLQEEVIDVELIVIVSFASALYIRCIRGFTQRSLGSPRVTTAIKPEELICRVINCYRRTFLRPCSERLSPGPTIFCLRPRDVTSDKMNRPGINGTTIVSCPKIRSGHKHSITIRCLEIRRRRRFFEKCRPQYN